jgi:hypothetical protein
MEAGLRIGRFLLFWNEGYLTIGTVRMQGEFAAGRQKKSQPWLRFFERQK